jgi:hypothetical protein
MARLPLSDQLEFMCSKYVKYREDPKLMNKVYSGKNEMAKGFYNILISFVRKLRAFNFQPKYRE